MSSCTTTGVHNPGHLLPGVEVSLTVTVGILDSIYRTVSQELLFVPVPFPDPYDVFRYFDLTLALHSFCRYTALSD